jgi:hypothetical protein
MTEASVNQKTIRKTIIGIMLLMNCGIAVASEAEDAVEFMITGDKGWNGGPKG